MGRGGSSPLLNGDLDGGGLLEIGAEGCRDAELLGR